MIFAFYIVGDIMAKIHYQLNLDTELRRRIDERRKALGFLRVSEYIRYLIVHDLNKWEREKRERLGNTSQEEVDGSNGE